MSAIEKKIEALYNYKPELTKRGDFDAFWDAKLKEFPKKPLNARREGITTPMPYVDAYRVSYEGFDDTRINSLFLLPKFAGHDKLPCIVSFHGYLCGAGFPEQYAQWLLMGVAVMAVDVRGQGGETGNNLVNSDGMAKGFITQGILDREKSYFLAVAADCLKAVDWVWEQPEIDKSRICVTGSSQGGGLTLLTAALSDRVSLAMANVPNMCHMDLGIFTSTGSISEAADFANRFPDRLGRVLETLSYFDNMNLAERIKVPVLVSAAMKDSICPADTIFAAYNRITSEKSVHVFPFSGHALLGYFNREMMEFAKKRFFIL